MNKKHEEAIDWYAREFEAGFKRRCALQQSEDRKAGLEPRLVQQFGPESAKELTEKLIQWLADDCPIKETKDECV
jgi:hypothetical protein